MIANDAICFANLPDNEPGSWRRPRSFAFLDRLAKIVLSDSELLLTSYYLPVAIDCLDDELQVIAISHPRFQRSRLVGENGQWLRPYMPIALRCLPFRAAPGTKGDRLEIAVNLEQTVDSLPLPMFSSAGSLSPEVESIQALLRRLERGKAKLERAAEKLLIAGVLAPFRMPKLRGTAEVELKVLTVDRKMFAALSSARAAQLVKGDFLAVDLMAACIFSQRLVPHLMPVASDGGSSAMPTDSTINRHDFAASLKDPIQLDPSGLFSFDLLDDMIGRK